MGKKLTTSLLAGVFALSMVVSPVFGQSVEELQAQIQQLLAIISQLQQQIATLQGGQGTTGTYCFNTDLYQGLTSNDVRNLQIVLRVTPTTGYFGSITNSAVKRFQAQYGIPQTGYVGPLTRAKLNELYCTPVTPTTTTTLPGGTTTTTTVVAPSYGTLEVSSYPVSNPQTTLHGGQEYELLAAKFKAVGSDITLKKVALRVVHASNDAFPWQAFTTLALYDGSTKLAEIALNSSNAIENTFAQDYTFNISGLNFVIPNNSSKVLTVKGTTVVNPVSNAINNTWKVTLRADQLVFSDTAGVTYSVASGQNIDSQALNLQSTQTAAATVTLAVDNPKAQNVIVSDSSPSRVEVMKFNVGVKNLNATFNSGSVTVRISNTTDQSLITGVELWDGGTLLANSAPSSWTSENNSFKASITWSNFSLPIAAGTTKTLSVKLVLAQVASNFSNTDKHLEISTGPSLSGVDTNSNVVSANGSSLTSEKFYPFLKAPVFALSSATLTASGSTSSKVSDMGTAKIVFTVTANGGDIYIPTSGNTAITITGKINNGSPIATTNRAWICTNATENSTTNFWRIVSGNTATCEYNGVFTANNAGYYYVNISSIVWNTSATSQGAITQTWGIDTLKTGQTYLSGN